MSNWFSYIYAVHTEQVLAASLGYYINPIANVLCGALILRERLVGWRLVAVVLAIIGVGFQTWTIGLPWLSLAMALSFTIYGYLHKTTNHPPVIGLTIEMLIPTPFVLFLLWYNPFEQTSTLYHSWNESLLLMGTALLTFIPLVCFAYGAKRLRLGTLGFLQYIAPTLHFILGVVWYQEHFSWHHGVSFLFIWVALGVYSFDLIRNKPHNALAS